EAVPEERGGGEVNGEVEGLPEAASEADAEVRSGGDEGNHVEGGRADGVLERLAGGMQRIEKINDAELGGFVQEKNEGMEHREREGEIAGNDVQTEIVQATMRPLADGTIAEDHQRAEEHVGGDGSYGGEADVSGEVQDGDVHGN